MSNDLISREGLLKEIKLYCNRNFSGEITAQSEISVGELSTIIKNLPTAYDVDEVCQEIKRMMFEEASIEGIKIANKAIEIVRNGGIENIRKRFMEVK